MKRRIGVMLEGHEILENERDLMGGHVRCEIIGGLGRRERGNKSRWQT